MNMRKLGRSGLETAPLVLGTNVFLWLDEAVAFELLDAFVGEGFNLIDTANVYGPSETFIGNWLRRRSGMRARVLIATKVGVPRAPGRGGLSKKCILEEVDESLRRLGTDYVDIYQSHVDDSTTPLEETLAAYTQLVREGKVRAIGASNTTREHLAKSLSVSAHNGLERYETLQPLYNLYHRAGFETQFAKLCAEKQLGIIPYFSLASGFLTGKYKSHADYRQTKRAEIAAYVFDTESLFEERGRRILEALENVSTEMGATPAEAAVGWLTHRVTAPISSATSTKQLHELMRGASRGLPAGAMKLLDDASAYG